MYFAENCQCWTPCISLVALFVIVTSVTASLIETFAVQVSHTTSSLYWKQLKATSCQPCSTMYEASLSNIRFPLLLQIWRSCTLRWAQTSNYSISYHIARSLFVSFNLYSVTFLFQHSRRFPQWDVWGPAGMEEPAGMKDHLWYVGSCVTCSKRGRKSSVTLIM